MSTIEMDSALPLEDDQKETPIMDISTPINFAETTAADFGISVKSFVPSSLPSSNRKEKSRLAQLKSRRRSNIGARGSPETNSLIRFMAKQKMKTPPSFGTPEHVRSSPFLPGTASTLRQKMASFQSLMGVEESEDSSFGGCIMTRDDLSDGENLEAGKENHPPLKAFPPNKRRRLGPTQGCVNQIREDTPLLFNVELEEEDASVKCPPLPSSETRETAAEELVISPVFPEGLQPVSDALLWSPTEDQQEVVFELQRIQEPSPDDPTAVLSAQPAVNFHSPSISSLLEMKPAANTLSSSAVKRRKKQVRFGEPLLPELFDKTLPPSTPLQKGGTPARAPTPGGALRSLLKTPQGSNSPTAVINSPSFLGASPTLSMPRSRRMTTSEGDDEQMSGKIPFPLEELEIEAAIGEESPLIAQPLNLDTAFTEDSLSHNETECETKASESTSPKDPVPPEPLQQEEQPPQTDAAAQASGGSSCKRRGKVTLDTTEAPARSGGRKRKLPEESEPVKRSSRAAAKTASGKMKLCTTARQWNKKVDRSLYGSRAYASKNPSLSPIRERLSFLLSFNTEEPLPALSPQPQPDLCCNGNSVSGDPATSKVSQTGDMTALNASTTPQVSLSFPQGAKHSGVRRTRRLSGSKCVGRALKGRKVSVNEEQMNRTEENVAADIAMQEEPEEAMLKETIIEVAGDAVDKNNVTNKPEMDEKGPSESLTTSFSAGEEPKQVLGEIESSQDGQPNKLSNEIEMQIQQQNTPPKCEGKEEEAVAATVQQLLPWQNDFNFDDVFKPVAKRGQRSVRRSLRNVSSADPSGCEGGTTWVPHISPETIKESRRRTRGRRLSAALPSLPFEDIQP